MPNHPFDHLVKFMQTARLVRHITSADEALYFPEHKWPYEPGDAHELAVGLYQDALNGTCAREDASESFLLALQEGQFDLVQ